MAKSIKSALREWAKQGWKADKTAGGHWKLTHPDAHDPVFTSSTPSDHRTLLNTEAQMRRAIRRAQTPQPTMPQTRPSDNAAAHAFGFIPIPQPVKKGKRPGTGPQPRVGKGYDKVVEAIEDSKWNYL